MKIFLFLLYGVQVLHSISLVKGTDEDDPDLKFTGKLINALNKMK